MVRDGAECVKNVKMPIFVHRSWSSVKIIAENEFFCGGYSGFQRRVHIVIFNAILMAVICAIAYF